MKNDSQSLITILACALAAAIVCIPVFLDLTGYEIDWPIAKWPIIGAGIGIAIWLLFMLLEHDARRQSNARSEARDARIEQLRRQHAYFEELLRRQRAASNAVARSAAERKAAADAFAAASGRKAYADYGAAGTRAAAEKLHDYYANHPNNAHRSYDSTPKSPEFKPKVRLDVATLAKQGYDLSKVATKKDAKKVYHAMIHANHPDRGGNEVRFRKLKELFESYFQSPDYDRLA